MGKVILAALLGLILAACQTTTGGRGGAFCDVASPRRPSQAQQAVMSDEAKRQDVAFNRYGAKHCGWRP